MAKIHTETIVITFNKLVKENEEASIINDDLLGALESVAQELAGAGIIVETMTA